MGLAPRPLQSCKLQAKAKDPVKPLWRTPGAAVGAAIAYFLGGYARVLGGVWEALTAGGPSIID